MDSLKQIVQEEVRWYAGKRGRGANVLLFPALDDEHLTYVVIGVSYPHRGNDVGNVIVFARIVGNQVIIEEDNTDKPLHKHLMERGIPRDKIILAYAGEPIPDAARFALPGEPEWDESLLAAPQAEHA